MSLTALAQQLIAQAAKAARSGKLFTNSSHEDLFVGTGVGDRSVIVALHQSKENEKFWEFMVANSEAQAHNKKVELVNEPGCWKLTFIAS